MNAITQQITQQITVSPIDGREYVRRDYASDAAIEIALRKAKAAQRDWQHSSIAARAVMVTNAIDHFVAMKSDIAMEVTRQIGRPIRYTPSEVGGFETRARYMISIAEAALRREEPTPLAGFTRYIKRDPVGVVFVVAPWNYPFQLAVIPLVNAIAAGNRVMIKPSEFTPKLSALLHKMLGEVFAADEVVVVQGDAEVGAAFTALPFDHLLFTGSTSVGRHVMAAAAPNLTPVTLELGGKSPALIAPDYPLEHAAERIATGKCFNAGQTCVAPDYVLVPREKRDEFAKLYLAAVKKRFPTVANNPDVTAVVNSKQATRLRAWLEDARQRGVVVQQYIPEGETIPEGLEIIPPTLLFDPPDDALVMQQEIFGPLLPLKSYDTHQQAIDYILQRDRPLAFYPFDRDSTRLNKTLDIIIAGSVCVNDTLIQFGQHELPIGGVGPSGMGQYHGHAGFLTFSKAMPVMYQTRFSGVSLFDPPYGKLANWLVNFLTR